MPKEPTDWSLQNAKSLVPEEFEELAEASILQQELGMLITELRVEISNIRAGAYADLDQRDIADIIEGVINGG